jgi:hypothetical protein
MTSPLEFFAGYRPWFIFYPDFCFSPGLAFSKILALAPSLLVSISFPDAPAPKTAQLSRKPKPFSSADERDVKPCF